MDLPPAAGADAAQPSEPYPSAFRAWSLVGLLGALYILSFVDRGVLALLVRPLKADLHLTDFQIGLLYGTAFAVFYSLLGVPVARLADAGNRRLMILAGATLWGLCTLGSGFAASFLVLNVLRVGLAMGESALTPSAHSIVGDLFPPHRRAFAASVFLTIGLLGAGVGVIAVGFLIQYLTTAVASGELVTRFAVWQLVLLSVGGLTMVVAAIFAIFAREPKRRLVAAGEPGASNRELLAYLAKHRRLYIGLFLGAGLMQASGGAFGAWGAEFMRRSYGWDIRTVASVLGTLGLVVITGSTLLGPVITRALLKRGRPDAVVLVAMSAAAIGGVLSVVSFLQTNPMIFVALHVAGGFVLAGGSNNVLFALQDLAPARMRGTLVASLVACFNLFAMGFGPPLAALISDSLSPAGDKLWLGLALQGGLTVGPALLLLAWSRKGMLKAMRERAAVLPEAAAAAVK